MTTDERFIQPDDQGSDDEVARLVRLAGPTGSTGPAEAPLGRSGLRDGAVPEAAGAP